MILLDTHVWLWWTAAPERLSTRATAAIGDAVQIAISTLSVWELTMLVVRGRVALDRDVQTWVRQALAQERVVALAPDAQHAVAAGLLDRDRFPGDSVDRILYATARSRRLPLVTRDRALRAFDRELTVW